MKTLITLALLAVSINAESICGKRFSTPQTHIIEVVCIESKEPFNEPVTELWITTKFGDAIEATVGIQYRISKIIQVLDGSQRALITFWGINHTELPVVKVLVYARS